MGGLSFPSKKGEESICEAGQVEVQEPDPAGLCHCADGGRREAAEETPCPGPARAQPDPVLWGDVRRKGRDCWEDSSLGIWPLYPTASLLYVGPRAVGVSPVDQQGLGGLLLIEWGPFSMEH